MRCGDYQSEYENTIQTLKKCLPKENNIPELDNVAIVLKDCLSKMNNIITARLSYKFLEFLKQISFLNQAAFNKAKTALDESNTNSNGYDIHIEGELPILAEIKSTLPCDRDGTIYGPAQQNEILNDINRLFNEARKKRELQNRQLTDYYRFLVLLESPEGKRTQRAIDNLMKKINASDLSNSCYYLDKNTPINNINKKRIGILCISL